MVGAPIACRALPKLFAHDGNLREPAHSFRIHGGPVTVLAPEGRAGVADSEEAKDQAGRCVSAGVDVCSPPVNASVN